MKETKLTERFSLEFGVQAFNIFNHVQLGDPSNLKLDYVPNPSGPGFITQAGSNFGVINGTVNFNNNNERLSPVSNRPTLTIRNLVPYGEPLVACEPRSVPRVLRR